MTRSSLRIGAAASAACLAATLSACASVPTGGPVVQGAGGSNDVGQGGSYARLIPAGPQPGVGETGLIRGFLGDMGSFEEDYEAARLYMTDEERASWSPDGTVLVYGEMDSVGLDVRRSEDGERAEVRMRTPLAATIDPSGQYVPAGQGEIIDVTFELARVGGEWRISELPEEIMLSRRDVDRAFRPLNLYYFNRDMSTLVPDPIFLPVQPTSELPDQLSRMLATMLVSGPTDWLEPAVRSSFPGDATADVSYDSGLVTVELSSEADGADPEERLGMVAQLVWTLKQLPDVRQLTLNIGGDEVRIPASEDENLQTDSGTWSSVNPSGVTGNPRAYFMRDGQLWSLDGRQQEARSQGAPGIGDTPLEQHAVSLDEDKVAGVGVGDNEVVVAELTEGGAYTTVLSGGEYTSLSWDGYGNLWVAEDISAEKEAAEEDEDEDVEDDTERGDPPAGSSDADPEQDDAAGTRLWLLRGGTDPIEVTAPELSDRTVTRLRASRDGTRVALLTEDGENSQVLVGRVVYDDAGVLLQAFLPLATDLNDVSDLAWRGADQLAVLGQKERAAVQAHLVPLDGSTQSTSAGATTGVDMKSIAAAPGQPLLAGTEDDYVSMTNDRLMWERVTDGTNPVYPG
ncbi:hypothetical protein HDA32_004763 [Spinactinospora alkalitolerans]|uniref:Lipoprotein LpqB n=1 Tax=Spinactinospora alkalitolerans TaxID=687207 RepID=A0A852U405_9ACTN|nr:LpqB family beta-propeller domain-containing protein [Spinactinospora alkalitolerans]NYE49643.1 hypothetical protein [Spinactinospora alkalitolerans]